MTSQQPTPSHLLAFPSVSSALHTLPQATSIHSIALHPGMYASAESNAKLDKALALSASARASRSGCGLLRSGSSTATLPTFRVTPPQAKGGEEDDVLTMRTVCLMSTLRHAMPSLSQALVTPRPASAPALATLTATLTRPLDPRRPHSKNAAPSSPRPLHPVLPIPCCPPHHMRARHRPSYCPLAAVAIHRVGPAHGPPQLHLPHLRLSPLAPQHTTLPAHTHSPHPHPHLHPA
ncbi:hypothetical protein HYPSUDRAFT_200300 [Hypholoma sublateritium FD-334 SS-4]|uniref:Uncharacterized protein n=1 Tax=Hypholoma sublateritium (strain FD-334 SS-4) TaxID=945553 RepID=A0A0D2P7Y9_HYPSF|nr:hypothetical protein HYPSUDRAFT_200300 [Hypholoma sublateritium FD-334 SS-4]